LGLLDDLNVQGKTIIVVTHDMRLVAEHARKVAVMHAGSLIFHGTPRDLFAQPGLMAQAHLDMPPVARLTSLLSTQYSNLKDCITLNDLIMLENNQPVPLQS
jgi:energy-coupling factor transport system ATP-binding protein